MNYMTKDLPKNSQVFFRSLNNVSTVRATMMEGICKNNDIRCSLFMLVDILNFKFICQMYSFVILTCYSCICFSVNYLINYIFLACHNQFWEKPVFEFLNFESSK